MSHNKQNCREVNFDGLVGPTHNYAGLAFGNTASLKHAHQISHPRQAALQSLEKMHLLMQLELIQAVLPPHERPNLPLLRQLGFRGSDIQILTQAKKVAPALFYACYSSSSMWAANAATVSPSRDSQDSKLHVTPANLLSHLHRAIEAEMTHRMFKQLLNDETKFVVHDPLPSHLNFADEGAANHSRLCSRHENAGLEIFVYGRAGFEQGAREPSLYPARQTLEASQAIARRHQLMPKDCLFIKQNPAVIDAGVFHNDVIAVINENVLLVHELAFENFDEIVQTLQKSVSFPISLLKIQEKELSVQTAVQTYLFNSQLVTLPNASMALIAPVECQTNPKALSVLQKILATDNPIEQLYFVDCSESMRNGGGPACLRLRMVLTADEQKAVHPDVFLQEQRYQALTAWVKRFYREQISDQDLLDPLLLEESQAALDALTQLLNLGSLYSFQY